MRTVYRLLLWLHRRELIIARSTGRRRASIAQQVRSMLDFQKHGSEVCDNGNLIRTQAQQGGGENAFDIPIFT